MAVLGVKIGLKFKFWFVDPKGDILVRNRLFDVFSVKIRAGVLAVDDLKNTPKNEQIAE